MLMSTGALSELQTEIMREIIIPEIEKEVPERKDEVLREWSDSTGTYKVKAYFKSFANGLVKLRRDDDGRLVDVPLDRLSDNDKAWIQSRRN